MIDPLRWAGRAQWRILDTRFDATRFLSAWQAWRQDPQRPRLLHVVALLPGPLHEPEFAEAAAQPLLQPLALQIGRLATGLTPGFHRFAFEGGRVLLTLCVGEAGAMLRELVFQADAVHLDADWPADLLKAVARLCRRGTELVASHGSDPLEAGLRPLGFQPTTAQATGPGLQARYDPPWEVRGLQDGAEVSPQRAIVIGAGLAGAAVASSLARRGWRVQVLDAGDGPARGASALPAGLMAPHQSPDDNPLSRLSRAGIRLTWQEAERLLRKGQDWMPCGALEQRRDDPRPPPSSEAWAPWTRVATQEECAHAAQTPGVPGWWHERAAWVKPHALVQAWLAGEGIEVQTQAWVQAVRREEDAWRVLREDGETLATAPLVVLAAAHGSAALAGGALTTHPVRGQVSWGLHASGGPPPGWPACAVNGDGHFLPSVPLPEGSAWLSGATYGRRDADTAPRDADTDANLRRLRGLAPAVATHLEPQFAGGKVNAWVGVRCASQDRKPLVGMLEPGLWTSTALGSRGLTFAVLLAELLAARLHGEPWPIEARLAAALDTQRFRP